MKEYLPFFQRHAADIFMIDVPWNGIAQGKKVGDLAATFQHNIAPHNHYSHLSTFMSAGLCAALANVRIMEIDIDDVPWKDELATRAPEIVAGYMTIPRVRGGAPRSTRKSPGRIRGTRAMQCATECRRHGASGQGVQNLRFRVH